MGIAQYIKEIGRGKDGARALSREQASDLLGQVLDGRVSDLEIGAFCLAMRIKGETAQEMAGFLDAVHARLNLVASPSTEPMVVIPSYNGARRLPVLSPLLALLLARRGVPVLMHGQQTEDKRICAQNVLLAGAFIKESAIKNIAFQSFEKHFEYRPTAALLPSLARLLDVRRTVGVRNSAHSLVKLMNPVAGPALIISSYTHPEYLHSMTQTLLLTQGHAMLLRGTEGEAVADARRTPQMDVFLNGQAHCVQAQQEGSLQTVPDLPPDTSAEATAQYTHDVLDGRKSVPTPIALQVEHILHALEAMNQPHTAEYDHALHHA
jgi:anthranilate phosphoribosyltransferase